MKRKLVIHIGLRKTGSSALQEILGRERDSLCEHNIDYPISMTNFDAHQELAWCLMDPTPDYANLTFDKDEVYSGYVNYIDDNIEKGVSTLLSTEDLSLLTFNFEILEYVRQRLSRYNPLIVFYARDPISYHISNYKHSLVDGRETRTFSEYVFNYENIIYSNPLIYYKLWSGVFGLNNVRMLKYDKSKFTKISIFSDFLKEIFGIVVDDNYQKYKSNTGIPNEAVEYILALNRSDLPNEEVIEIKNIIRGSALPSDEDGFLESQLTDNELNLLKKILSINIL